MYLSVWVGLRYTDVRRWLSSLLTRTSRSGSPFSYSSSMVNLMDWFCWFRCWWNLSSSSSPCGQITKVSSTYLIHMLGFCVIVFRALSSRLSMKIFAIAGNNGDPNCSVLFEKRVFELEVGGVQAQFNCLTISEGGKFVLSSSVSSCSSRCEITTMASGNGTLVKRLTTSKLTIFSLAFRTVFRTRSAKSKEFLMNESDLPVSRLMILVRNFAMS